MRTQSIFYYSNIKIVICIFFGCGFSLSVYGQNKKEQIDILTARLDSLVSIALKDSSVFVGAKNKVLANTSPHLIESELLKKEIEILQKGRINLDVSSNDVLNQLSELTAKHGDIKSPVYCEGLSQIDVGSIRDGSGNSPTILLNLYVHPESDGGTGATEDRKFYFNSTPFTGKTKFCRGGVVEATIELKDGDLDGKVNQYDSQDGKLIRTQRYSKGKLVSENYHFNPLDYYYNINDFETPKVYVYEVHYDYFNGADSSYYCYEYWKVEKTEKNKLKFTTYDKAKNLTSVSIEEFRDNQFYFTYLWFDGITAEISSNAVGFSGEIGNPYVANTLSFLDDVYKVNTNIDTQGFYLHLDSKLCMNYIITTKVLTPDGNTEMYTTSKTTCYKKGTGIFSVSMDKKNMELKRIISLNEFELQKPFMRYDANSLNR